MAKKVICLFGPQGSGKGTQAKILTDKLQIPHISTGDLFRIAIENKTELGKQVEDILKSGELVPDRLTFDLLKERIMQNDCANGFILDGYPRTINQAQLFDDYIETTNVIIIDISDEESLKRLTNRRHHLKTGKIYNLYTSPKPPKEIEHELVQRADDTADAIKNRLKKYHQETEPLFDYYKEKVIRVNGEQSIEKVAQDIAKNLNI
ncbi:adenylate kinase [Candidatus Falkowbacteria bacterium CG10_big_fil_rev_8_21_14_0_10_37_6]|uniref:Adenylate kinase n=1 Tax=Candidatus Falkowbacteria bacterium CG10_big_fil_rev_8_21_14_0_10_37_6 TaxID=1974563 RepID=A0A2H0V744_9BACT|nr:MAG: adenylate kinase [Candidatus Falkowbacteria bacterium CG10_big_fil_rev_8_21_14_0_10_37_6]